MKLYYFNPNNYGGQFFVMAKSLSDAIAAVQRYIDEQKANGLYPFSVECRQNELDAFVAGSGKRTIDTYEEGDVIESEIC